MPSVVDDNAFAGPIGAEYDLLAQLSPGAGLLARRVGEHVAAWDRAGTAGSRLRGLEIGCGTGAATRWLLAGREDLDLLALDSSATMLEQARTNLAGEVARGRLRLIEADALETLAGLPDAGLDVVASNYALHNFGQDYRERVLAEILRVLAPGGVLVNGDRYAIDDPRRHLEATQAELRRWFRLLGEHGRLDLLEDWTLHLLGDESPAHVMPLSPALEQLGRLGFASVQVEFRDGVDALVTAVKPRVAGTE